MTPGVSPSTSTTSATATRHGGVPAAAGCLNCGAAMVGPVCAQCGQREAGPIAVRRILGEVFGHLVSLDFKLLHTTVAVLVRPGILVQDYLRGRRIPYTNPFKLLFLSATVYLVLVTALGVPLSAGTSSDQTASAVVAFVNYLVYLFLVPTAWWLGVLFRRAGHNWAESYVIVCYLWAGYLLLASALAPPMALVGSGYFAARTLVGLVYAVVSLRSIFRVGWWTATWKGALFYAGYVVATGLVMGGIVTVAYLVDFAPLKIPLQRP
jgi:hypothetical protein